MTITKLEQWRQMPQLVEWATNLFNTAEWKLLNQVLQEGEHVRLYDSPGVDGIQKLGRIEGWDLYNSTLKLAALELLPQKHVEATFAVPEVEAPQKPNEE